MLPLFVLVLAVLLRLPVLFRPSVLRTEDALVLRLLDFFAEARGFAGLRAAALPRALAALVVRFFALVLVRFAGARLLELADFFRERVAAISASVMAWRYNFHAPLKIQKAFMHN